jgi:hypothetical protein
MQAVTVEGAGRASLRLLAVGRITFLSCAEMLPGDHRLKSRLRLKTQQMAKFQRVPGWSVTHDRETA